MVFLSACILLGYLIRYLLTAFVWGGFTRIPDIALGIVGAVIVWPLMNRLKIDCYADKKTVNSISSCCLEILITCAIATLNLKSFQAYFVPILILCLSMGGMLAIMYTVYCAKFCKNEWFEKMVNLYGQGTGSSPTGLALLRTVDPENQSCSADASGVNSVLSMPVWLTMVTIGPGIALTSNGTAVLLLIGAGITVVATAVGYIFFRVPERRINGSLK